MPSRELRDWRLRVRDMLQAAQDIADFTEGLTFEDFQNNKMLVQSVLYNFVIIGEAAANIPQEIQEQYPEIPWRIMTDMRNVMAHEYFQVNLAVVWQTLQRSLPPVVSQLENL